MDARPATSGTFYISNQDANDVIRLTMSGLNTNDLYADITSENELVQIDPTTGKVTTILSGLDLAPMVSPSFPMRRHPHRAPAFKM